MDCVPGRSAGEFWRYMVRKNSPLAKPAVRKRQCSPFDLLKHLGYIRGLRINPTEMPVYRRAMTSSLNGMPGPTSRHYFSQRLRLHYVDWGNPEAPPLLLVHGGRDHCRNWDWVAQALRDDWHVICPDLRGHGDSQWSPDGNYAMSSYIYDLDQLIHQQGLAPVTIVAHSLGGNICLRYAGIFPDKVRKLVAIEGLGPSPKVIAERRKKTMAERMREWVDEQRKLSGRLPRRYPYHRGRLQAHAGRRTRICRPSRRGI